MMKNILIIEDSQARLQGLKKALITENLENSKNNSPLFADYKIFPSNNEYIEVCATIKRFASIYYQNKDDEKNKITAMEALSELYFYIFKLIEDNEITLVFSDLSLSMDEEQGETTGEKLIEKIFQNKLHKNLPVIVYSRHGKDSSYLKKKNILPKIFAYICSDSSTSDPAELRGLINGGITDFNQLEGLIDAYNDREYDYNLAVICALNKEHDKVKDLIPEKQWQRIISKENHKPYNKAYFENIKTNRILKVVLRNMGDNYGKGMAIKESGELIKAYKPQYIAMTGVAAGHKKNVNLGDVVIVRHTFDWEEVVYEGKDVLQRTNPQVTDKYINHIVTNFFLEDTRHNNLLANILEEYSDKKTIKELIAIEVENDRKIEAIEKKSAAKENRKADKNKISSHPGKLKYRFASIATGSSVVNSEEMIASLNKRQDKSAGIDMEIFGVYLAAFDTYSPNTKAVAIKTVVDYGNGGKDKKWQDFGSYASAKTLYTLFTEYIDVEPN